MFRLIIDKQVFKALAIPSYHQHRLISTTLRCNTNCNSQHNDGHYHDSSSECVALGSHPYDVSNLKLKLNYIQIGQSEMRADITDFSNKTEKKFDKTNSKIDCVFYTVITSIVGFIHKSGFDYSQAAKK
ncbi:hypothetical protein HOY82DRAFT_569185 [Tuber indicum]|nr:hypothetical protein HOY82DRAFT_569185 [Tuber indicum]